MKCPRCDVDLKSTDLGEYGFVIIDVCPDCRGAWFDKGELDRLDESIWTDVEKLDFETAANQRSALECPRCGGDTEPLSPHDAGELVVDRCTSCEGFWLDKGELDKMKEVAAEKDNETLKNMILLQRPPGWSWLRWSIYCLREYYRGNVQRPLP